MVGWRCWRCDGTGSLILYCITRGKTVYFFKKKTHVVEDGERRGGQPRGQRLGPLCVEPRAVCVCVLEVGRGDGSNVGLVGLI